MLGHGCGQRAWSRVWSHFGYGCGQKAWSKGVVIGRDQAGGCGQGCGHMLGLSTWSLVVVKGCCQTLWMVSVPLSFFVKVTIFKTKLGLFTMGGLTSNCYLRFCNACSLSCLSRNIFFPSYKYLINVFVAVLSVL